MPKKLDTTSRVVIIGNSPSILLHKYGKQIDSYDVVIRLNRCVTKGFEKYIGKKVKINVFDVRNKQELKKLMDMQLKILIVLKQVIYSMVIFVIYRMVWNI